jgi:hypothetical protein
MRARKLCDATACASSWVGWTFGLSEDFSYHFGAQCTEFGFDDAGRSFVQAVKGKK